MEIEVKEKVEEEMIFPCLLINKENKKTIILAIGDNPPMYYKAMLLRKIDIDGNISKVGKVYDDFIKDKFEEFTGKIIISND